MTTVSPRLIDFAGFPVRRLLPTRAVRAVGPWVFFDHMGPHTFRPGDGVDVVPHPHIGLATVTYLFDGEIIHRDTIGSIQAIQPGAINLMTAGRGIAHSERTAADLREDAPSVHGLQLWLGMPEDREEDEPAFFHYDASEIPESVIEKARVRVMMGSAFGLESPVETLSPTLYAQIDLDRGAVLDLPDDLAEIAVYPVAGEVSVAGAKGLNNLLQAGELAAFETGDTAQISARTDSTIIVIGGSPLGPRYMWWNFVSSRIDRIEQAKSDWAAGKFGSVVDDDGPSAPLPDTDGHARMKP